MFIVALCPTFRKPKLLANTLWQWNKQTYPADKRLLLMFDDGGTFHNQRGSNYYLHSVNYRWPGLPHKYNALLGMLPDKTTGVLVWDDDDIYLPNYIVSHVRVLEEQLLSKPSHILSDYTGKIEMESGKGRFHGTLGMRTELIDKLNGWPDTHRADFDQQMINACERAAGPNAGSPWGEKHGHQYVYSWHTDHAHATHTMDSPDCETWYQRAAKSYPEVPFVGTLVPKQDERTAKIIKAVSSLEL